MACIMAPKSDRSHQAVTARPTSRRPMVKGRSGRICGSTTTRPAVISEAMVTGMAAQAVASSIGKVTGVTLNTFASMAFLPK
jgi:hypothetical protein